MENLNVNPTLAEGDLLELSPLKMPNSILKPSQKDNLIMLQTPVHKHLKVSFITPKRTPAQTPLQHVKTDGNPAISGSVLQDNTQKVLNTPSQMPGISQNLSAGFETPKTGMPPLRKGIVPRRAGVSSHEMLAPSKKAVENSSSQKTETAKSEKDSKWDSLRKLDENLRWRERVEVITKLDHQEYTDCAKECILQMIDKALDISLSKHAQAEQTPDVSSVMTSSSIVTTPMVNQSSVGIISPIVPRSNHINTTQEGEVMTPASTLNATYDISAHGSFVVEDTDKAFGQKHSSAHEIGEDNSNSCFKAPEILKPASVRASKKNVAQRSASVSDQIGNTCSKNAFTVGSRSYSFDLDNIPEIFDPFSPRQTMVNCAEKSSVATPHQHGPDRSTSVTHDISANQSVFLTPADTTPFAMRAVDVAFGNEEFVDSARLLQQGHLDLDYLDKKTTGAISQDLRKQSLYVKFDPLLEGLGSRQSIALLGRKSDIIDFTGRVTPVPEEPAEEATISPREPDLLCDSPSQIVGENSTFNCSQAPRGSAGSRGDSVSSASPCPQTSAPTKPDFGIIEVLKYSEEDIQRILKRKKQKWAREKEASLQRQKDLEISLRNQEILMVDFEERSMQHQKAVSDEKDKKEGEMAALKEEKKRVDVQILTLTKATGDVFQRMEKLQKNLTNLQTNELKQNEHMKAFREKCSASQKKIYDLETETAEALKKIMVEKNELESSIAVQLQGLQNKIKAAELKAKSLQTTLDHKKNENKEIMKICDELLATNGVQ